MKKAAASEITRGQAISFRIPSDTPDFILKGLQKLKETERRNFSSKLAEFVMEGVANSYSRDRETVTIPLPNKLTKAQRDWLKHEHSEALLGSILHQLIADPVRSAALLVSLNSKSLDIDEVLYLQEEVLASQNAVSSTEHVQKLEATEEQAEALNVDVLEDDLNSFDWAEVEHEEIISEEKQESDDVEDLLGGFLANMNK